MIDLLLFNPLAAMFGATTALLLVLIALSNRRTRTVLVCLAILSPGAPLFLAAGLLTVARLLVWRLTRMMPNAAAMSRAAVRLEEALLNRSQEEDRDTSNPVADRGKVLRFPQR